MRTRRDSTAKANVSATVCKANFAASSQTPVSTGGLAQLLLRSCFWGSRVVLASCILRCSQLHLVTHGNHKNQSYCGYFVQCGPMLKQSGHRLANSWATPAEEFPKYALFRKWNRTIVQVPLQFPMLSINRNIRQIADCNGRILQRHATSIHDAS